jgi:hypothetical protein
MARTATGTATPILMVAAEAPCFAGEDETDVLDVAGTVEEFEVVGFEVIWLGKSVLLGFKRLSQMLALLLQYLRNKWLTHQ